MTVNKAAVTVASVRPPVVYSKLTGRSRAFFLWPSLGTEMLVRLEGAEPEAALPIPVVVSLGQAESVAGQGPWQQNDPAPSQNEGPKLLAHG